MVGVLAAVGNLRDLGLARLTVLSVNGVGADEVLRAGELHHIADLDAGCGIRRCPRIALRPRRNVATCLIGDVGYLTVLRPFTGIVAAFGADVCHSGNLDAVLPPRRTLHGQSVADVDADMPGHPNSLADHHLVPAGGADSLAFGNHAVGADVRAGSGIDCRCRGVDGPAIGARCVAAPAPQDAFDEVHAVEAEHGRGLVGRRLNHAGAVCGPVVLMVLAVPAHVGPGQRSAEAPHDVQRLVVLGDVDTLRRQLFVRH